MSILRASAKCQSVGNPPSLETALEQARPTLQHSQRHACRECDRLSAAALFHSRTATLTHASRAPTSPSLHSNSCTHTSSKYHGHAYHALHPDIWSTRPPPSCSQAPDRSRHSPMQPSTHSGQRGACGDGAGDALDCGGLSAVETLAEEGSACRGAVGGRGRHAADEIWRGKCELTRASLPTE